MHDTKLFWLFDDATWLNHGCFPNAEAARLDDKGVLQVHAIEDIASDDEIVISYLPQPYGRKKQKR